MKIKIEVKGIDIGYVEVDINGVEDLIEELKELNIPEVNDLLPSEPEDLISDSTDTFCIEY